MTVTRRDDIEPTEGPFFNRNRPYDGQPHTDNGVRGQVRLHIVAPEGLIPRADRPLDPKPITLRDIYDAMLVGILQAKKRESKVDGRTLPLDQIMTHSQLWQELEKDIRFDPVAAAQNATVEIEKRLGIFPNVPMLVSETGDED